MYQSRESAFHYAPCAICFPSKARQRHLTKQALFILRPKVHR